MNRLAPLLLLIAAAPASAEITHSIQSSVQMNVDGAASAAQRIGSSLAVSGNNVTLSTSPTLGSLTAGSAVGYTPGAYSVTTAGDAFSYSESFTEGDATPAATSVTTSSGNVDALPMLGVTTTTSGGVAGSMAASIATDGAMSLTAGSAGTSITGQVTQTLQLK